MGTEPDIVAFNDEEATKVESLDRILGPLRHPDVLAHLPTVINRLQGAGGEDWAIGDALRHALATLSGTEGDCRGR